MILNARRRLRATENIGANQQIFTFGGSANDSSVKAVEWNFSMGPPQTISVGNNSNSDNGTSLVVELERTPAGTNVTSQVLVEITGGTAAAGGGDYDDSAFLPAGLLVTFNPGDTIVSVPIPIVSDGGIFDK